MPLLETVSGTEDDDIAKNLFTENTPATDENATIESGSGKKIRLRLDFTPDSEKIVRARLRSGSGKNRSKARGGVYVPLGRIEDVYSDPYYREWHGRCEAYAQRTGYQLVKSGSGICPDSGTPDHGMVELEESRSAGVVDD